MFDTSPAGPLTHKTLKLLGAGDIRRLLAEIGFVPSRQRGQNFLADPNIVRRIVRLADVQPGDHVLEVGIGLGSLTLGLIEAGGLVTGVEIERKFGDIVRAQLPEGELENLSIVTADATRVDWPQLLGDKSWKMVSNLPYSVGTRVLIDLLMDAPMIDTFLVMVQKEVGERLVAQPNTDSYAISSVKAAYYCDVKLVGRVKPSVFIPHPEVDSALVLLKRRPHAPVAGDPKAVFRVVDVGFGQRRKTIRQALASKWPVESVDEALKSAAIDPKRRAETLSLEEFSAISSALTAPELD